MKGNWKIGRRSMKRRGRKRKEEKDWSLKMKIRCNEKVRTRRVKTKKRSRHTNVKTSKRNRRVRKRN